MSMPDELNILELHRPLESGRMRGNGRDTEHVPAQQRATCHTIALEGLYRAWHGLKLANNGASLPGLPCTLCTWLSS